MSHYDSFYEELAETARKDAKNRMEQEVLQLKSEGFSEQEIKVILKAKEVRN